MNHIETSGAANRRTVLMGQMPLDTHTHTPRNATSTNGVVWQKKMELIGNRRTGRDWKSGGGGQNQKPQAHRSLLNGKYPFRRAGVVPTGTTGEGGAFSNPEEQFGQKSQFNKEKWLPLARDVPVMISHYCCQKMKKLPLQTYQRRTGMKPFLGTMAEESRLRTQAWVRHGCNAFEATKQTSQPLSFWTEQDVLRYTLVQELPMASVYGDIVAVDEDGNEYDPDGMIGGCGTLKCTGCQRTGCIFCGFGAHLEKPGEGRFERLAFTHPKQYDYCINGGQWVDNPAYDPTAPKMDGEWQNWNPKKIWGPSKKGLGMGKVFDMVNEIYGKDFYRYE